MEDGGDSATEGARGFVGALDSTVPGALLDDSRMPGALLDCSSVGTALELTRRSSRPTPAGM